MDIVEIIMIKQGFDRRDFIKGTSALALTSFASSPSTAQADATQRLDWNTFRTTRNYSSLVNAIATMKQNATCCKLLRLTLPVRKQKAKPPWPPAYLQPARLMTR